MSFFALEKYNTTFPILHKTVKSLFTLILLPFIRSSNIQTKIFIIPLSLPETNCFQSFLFCSAITYARNVVSSNKMHILSLVVWSDYKN